MSMLRRRTLAVSFCLVLTPCITLAEGKNKEAAALLENAKQLSDIRAEGSPGFVLKAEFKVLRDPDHPIVGSYSEVWASSSLVRTETSAGEFRRTEVIHNTKRWETSSILDIPKDVSAASKIAYRLDGNALSLSSWEPTQLENRTSGSWTLRCVIGRADSFGGKPKVCFEKPSGELVTWSVPFISNGGEVVSTCAYTDFQKFGEKPFPMSVRCFEGDKLILEGTVVQLSSRPSDDSAFVAPQGAKEWVKCSTGLKPPEAIESPEPTGFLGEPVVLSLIVGTDGRPHDIKVHTSSGAGTDTDTAALNAVRRWRFRPATCAGQPMEVPMNVIVRSHTDGL